MVNYIKSFYIQQDAEMQTLTRNAMAGLLQKLLFLRQGRTRFADLYDDYKAQLGTESIEAKEVEQLLGEMVEKGMIRCQDGLFYLSTNKMQAIERTRQLSHERKERVVTTYFREVYTGREELLGWLDDVLIRFFDGYSSEWVSDLYYRKSYVAQSKGSLLNMVRQRTHNYKKVDKRDRDHLPDLFIEMLLVPNDVDVNQMLWEYGTTAFSAKLVTSSHGANPVTLDIFRDSICLLDTNILMNIGLEESNYYNTLSSLEKVYEHLGIKVKILTITRDEYLHTIQNIKDEIIKLVSKGYSDEVMLGLGDQYIRTAIQRRCETEEDYEQFFEGLLQLPDCFHEQLEIQLEDSIEIEDSISKRQADERFVSDLRVLHESVHNVKKPTHSLLHDVGLIAGAEELRKNKKAFILSQDSTIAAYSKQCPLEHGLTLSLQMETLINVLALDSGGVEIDPQNYIPLFAQMIRQGLQPDSRTFQVQDLARMSDMEQEVTKLPDADVVRLATDVASMRLRGESEENINLRFRRNLQDVKRGIVDELEDTRRDVVNEMNEKERFKTRSAQGEHALEAEIRKRVTRTYDRKMWYKAVLYIVLGIVLPGLLIALNYILVGFKLSETWANILLSVVVELAAAGIVALLTKPWRIVDDLRNRERVIEEEVLKEKARYYN